MSAYFFVQTVERIVGFVSVSIKFKWGVASRRLRSIGIQIILAIFCRPDFEGKSKPNCQLIARKDMSEERCSYKDDNQTGLRIWIPTRLFPRRNYSSVNWVTEKVRHPVSGGGYYSSKICCEIEDSSLTSYHPWQVFWGPGIWSVWQSQVSTRFQFMSVKWPGCFKESAKRNTPQYNRTVLQTLAGGALWTSEMKWISKSANSIGVGETLKVSSHESWDIQITCFESPQLSSFPVSKAKIVSSSPYRIPLMVLTRFKRKEINFLKLLIIFRSVKKSTALFADLYCEILYLWRINFQQQSNQTSIHHGSHSDGFLLSKRYTVLG
jgi:hypothetical protein